MGKAATAILADKGYRVVMLCRDEGRGRIAHQDVISVSGRRVDLMLCDLGDLASVRSFSALFHERYPQLDVLINNAGVITLDRRETADGLELQFGVNHIGHFLLTTSLLDLLERSDQGRIVVYSSGAHKWGRMHFDDYNLTRRYNVMRSYGQSKLANVYFTKELARRLQEGGSKVTINACHPGAVATQMGVDRNTGFGKRLVRVLRPLFQTPEEGCRTAVYLATSDEVRGVSGEYFYKCRKAKTSHRARDADAARRLYELSERIVSDALARRDRKKG